MLIKWAGGERVKGSGQTRQDPVRNVVLTTRLVTLRNVNQLFNADQPCARARWALSHARDADASRRSDAELEQATFISQNFHFSQTQLICYRVRGRGRGRRLCLAAASCQPRPQSRSPSSNAAREHSQRQCN